MAAGQHAHGRAVGHQAHSRRRAHPPLSREARPGIPRIEGGSVTPSRSRGDRGTLAFDRHFKAVGRFRCASGTLDKRVFRQMDAMLTALYQQGRLDLLLAMRSRKIPMMQVYDAYRRGELEA